MTSVNFNERQHTKIILTLLLHLLLPDTLLHSPSCWKILAHMVPSHHLDLSLIIPDVIYIKVILWGLNQNTA